MKMRSIVGTSVLVLLTGCTIERVDSKTPPPAPVAAAPTATAAPAATNTTVAGAPGSGGEVTAGGVVGSPVGTVGASATVSWKNWNSASGEAPIDKCVKESNKELCWDATDNNCDGQIDEGCPYGGGNSGLHFLIAWKANVDLDLHVVDPSGNEVNFKQRAGGALVLDKDCHGDDCPQGNVENIFVGPGMLAAAGHYKVWIQDGNTKTDKDAQVPFMFGAGVGGHAYYVPFMIDNKAGTKKAFEFDIY